MPNNNVDNSGTFSQENSPTTDTVAPNPSTTVPAGTIAPTASVASVNEPDLNVPQPVGESAYRRIAHLADPIPEEELPRINANVNVMTITAWGSTARIKALRPQIELQMPKHDFTLFDAFEDIVLSLSYTDAVVRASTEEKRELTLQAEVVEGRRRALLDFAVGLTRFGLIDPKPLQQINKEPGYKPLVRDMATLIQLYRQNWSKLVGQVPLTLKDLDKYDREAIALGTAIGIKEQSPDGPREVSLQRRRVYTLFRRAIADIRKAAIYLHGEDGVDDIVPAFANIGKGPSKSEQEEADTDVESTGMGDDAEDASAPKSGSAKGAGAKVSTPNKKNGNDYTTQDPIANFTVNNPDNLPITDPFGRDGT